MSSASATKATVAELLERYAGDTGKPHHKEYDDAACRTADGHFRPPPGALRHLRRCAGLVRSAAPARGGAVHRAPPREHSAGGVRLGGTARLLLSNPLVSLRIAKPKAQRIAPPSAKEARLLYDAAAPHIQRVIVLGMATGRA